jgi:hypothetical protein
MPYMRVLASQVNGQRGDMSSDGTRGPHQRGHLHPVLPVEEEEEEEGEGVHIYGMVGKSPSPVHTSSLQILLLGPIRQSPQKKKLIREELLRLPYPYSSLWWWLVLLVL